MEGRDVRATVLIVDDDAGLRQALADRFEHWGLGVTLAARGEEALALAARRAFDLVVLDLSMPGMSGLEVLRTLKEGECTADVVVLTAHGSVEAAVEAMKLGADDFMTKPADFDLLRRVVDRALDRRRLGRVSRALRARTETSVIGDAPPMRRLLDTAGRAAAADTTLLISGESGTGKQVIAEHVHQLSPRGGGPFVYVNCVAISDDLVESTLFGHERGAFTGAISRKPGRLESAAGGTAFLDEIGDISSGLQAKLLHFLESGEFERVGGNQTVRVDCRVIAATNRDLEREVREGRFREDLYYRLNVINLVVPPLRERGDDVALLAEAFLARFAGELKRENLRYAARTLEIMRGYAWPGNVRQLKNAVERMVVLAPGETLTPELLPPEILAGPGQGDLLDEDLPYKDAMAAFKRHVIRRALARTGGNQTKAAERLGLQRSYLNRLLKELDAE
jgi:DNA-binding NtrC family response regulator